MDVFWNDPIFKRYSDTGMVTLDINCQIATR